MQYPFKWIALFLFSAGLACSIPGFGQPAENSSGPSVAISSPANGQSVPLGQELQVQSVSIDPQAVVRVELVVDGDVVWVDANARPEADTPFIVSQPWTPGTPGTHTIQARAYNSNNLSGASNTLTVEVAAPAAVVNSQVDSGSATDAPAPKATSPPDPTKTSPAPASTATQTPTPTIEPSPTSTAPPTATPAPRKFKPTGIEPAGLFKRYWNEIGAGKSRLGHPLASVISGRNYASQPFQYGAMIWWDNPENPDYIWVVDSTDNDRKSGKTSNLFPDTWQPDPEAVDEYSCDEARYEGPLRGFGKVWCQHPKLQSRLGVPVLPESGSGGDAPFAQVQFFQGGTMLYLPHSAEVFILYEQGDWQRFLN